MKELIPKINGWMLVAMATLVLVIYELLSAGMFFDGLTYASIAENYDPSSFWEMHYTATLKYHFYEHPPLAFFIQNQFFQWGFNEQAYCFFLLIVSFLFISRIFILMGGNSSISWFPALLFVGTPVVFWSFGNNMLENTITVLVLFNVWLTLYLILKSKNSYWFILSGMITVGCFLVKGPVGLFPMIIIPLYWYFIKEKMDTPVFKKHFVFYLIGIFSLILLFLFSESAKNFFDHYFTEQVFASVAGDREISESRFFILYKLFLELIIMGGLTGILFLVGFRNKEFKKAIFFFMIGLSASVPLLISAKQMGFYIVPSLPFFALGFSFLLNEKWARIFKSYVFTLVLIPLFLIITPKIVKKSVYNERDHAQIEVVDTLYNTMYVSNEIISCSDKLKNDWPLHAYLFRYCKISLDTKNAHRYLIISKEEKVPENYSELRGFEKYILCGKSN